MSIVVCPFYGANSVARQRIRFISNVPFDHLNEFEWFKPSTIGVYIEGDSDSVGTKHIQRLRRMFVSGNPCRVSIAAETPSSPFAPRVERLAHLLDGQVPIGFGGAVIEARIHPTVAMTRVRRLLRCARAGMPILQAVGTDAAYDPRLAVSRRLVALLYGATGTNVGATRREL